jgi:hypothetical protein
MELNGNFIEIKKILKCFKPINIDLNPDELCQWNEKLTST